LWSLFRHSFSFFFFFLVPSWIVPPFLDGHQGVGILSCYFTPRSMVTKCALIPSLSQLVVCAGCNGKTAPVHALGMISLLVPFCPCPLRVYRSLHCWTPSPPLQFSFCRVTDNRAPVFCFCLPGLAVPFPPYFPFFSSLSSRFFFFISLSGTRAEYLERIPFHFVYKSLLPVVFALPLPPPLPFPFPLRRANGGRPPNFPIFLPASSPLRIGIFFPEVFFLQKSWFQFSWTDLRSWSFFKSFLVSLPTSFFSPSFPCLSCLA